MFKPDKLHVVVHFEVDRSTQRSLSIMLNSYRWLLAWRRTTLELFFHKKEKTFPERVASVLCTVDECRSLIANPEVLHELLVDETQTEPAYLKACLSKRIQEMFEQECLDCDDVFRLYLSVLRSDSPASPRLIGLAVRVFCNFFSTWNPAHVK